MDSEEIVRLELLGRWSASVDGRNVEVGPRQQRLLAALAVYGPRSRRFLCGLMWPECTEAHALGSLRAAVFALSSRLPGAVLCQGADLALNERVEADLQRLRRALDHPERFDVTSEEGRWLLEPSRAELLPGWYDDWVISQAERLMEDYIDFVEAHADAALAQDAPYQAVLLARVAHRLDPLREAPVRLLVQGHLALGDETAALREFRNHCAAVTRELGSRPSARLSALVHDLRHA